jgi:hypothetical protein
MILALERPPAANAATPKVFPFARRTRSNSDDFGVGAAPGRECGNAEGFAVRAQGALQQR